MEIGQRIKGFRWEVEEDELYYSPSMNQYIGEAGVVTEINSDRYTVKFRSGGLINTWEYPTALKERGIIKPVVGQRVKGFLFEGLPGAPVYASSMNDYINKVGVVTDIREHRNRYHVEFEDGESWWYPLSQAWKGLIEEEINTNNTNQLNVSTMRTKGFYVKPNFGGNRPTGLDAVKWTAYINFINKVGNSCLDGNSYSNNSLYGISMEGNACATEHISSLGLGAVEINLHDWWAQFISEYLPSKGFVIKNDFANNTSEAKRELALFSHRGTATDLVKWRTYIEFLNHLYGNNGSFGGDSLGDYYGISSSGLFNNWGRLGGFHDCTVMSINEFWNMITAESFNIQMPTAPEPIVEEEGEVEMVIDYQGNEQRLRDCVQLHEHAPNYGGEWALERSARYCEFDDGYALKSDCEREQNGEWFFSGNEDLHGIEYSDYDGCWLNTNRDDVYYGYVHGEDDMTWFVLSGWSSPYNVDDDYYRDSDALEYHDFICDEDDEWVSRSEYETRMLSSNNATYHSNERIRYGFQGERPIRFGADAKFTIGFEIEKEDADAVEIKFHQLYQRTGWVKEDDGSLNGDTGYELVTPAFDLYDNRLEQEIEADEELQQLVNADSSDNCGGHINLGSTIHSTEELFELLAGFFPLFYSIYEHRVEKNYSKAKKKHAYYAKDKYSAIFIKEKVVEFRIPSRVKNVTNLLWRRDLMRIMCSSIKSERIKALDGVHYKQVSEADVLKMLINPNSKLYKHMRKVFSHEMMIKKVEKFIHYAGEFNNTYLPRIIRSEFPADNINNNVEHDQDGMGA